MRVAQKLYTSLTHDALVVSWVFLALSVASSFYWWGRIETQVLKIPVVILAMLPVVFFWHIHVSTNRRARIVAHRATHFLFPLGILAFTMGISTFASADVFKAIPVFAEFVSYFVLFLVLVGSVAKIETLSLIVSALNLGLLFLAFEGLYSFFVTKTIWRIGAGDVHTATNMGAFMYQAVILLLVARLTLDRNQGWLCRFTLALALTCLIVAFAFTYSRGAWLTSIIGFSVIIWHRKVLIFAAVVFVCIGLLFAPAAVRNRVKSSVEIGPSAMVTLQDDVEISNTTQLRLRNMKSTLSDIAVSPFLGVGIGTYHGEHIGEDAPHNSYLRIWAESGPLGLTAFVWLLVLAVRAFPRTVPADLERRWLVIGLKAVLMTQIGYLLLGDFAYQMYFWFFLGLAVTAGKIVTEGSTGEG